MPLYEFRCNQCEREFEVLLASARMDQATCPDCGAGQPRRLMSVISGIAGRSSGSSPAGEAPVCGAGACERCS